VEVLENQSSSAATRPSYAISSSCPGSDLAGETAAALAAIAMVFAQDDPSYSATLLQHAEELYSFADTYRGKYSDCITDARSFYRSWSGYQDELVWSAAWLYRATGQQSYLNAAESHYQSMSKGHGWTHAWDDKSYGSFVLLAQLTGDSSYESRAQNWLDYWSTGYNGSQVSYTNGGLAQLDQWGANRYAANTAFIALIYSDYLNASDPGNSRIQTYYDFAVGQMEYLLGDNPMGHPYQVGLAANGPINPHHRTAHGSWNDQISSPTDNRHLLVGALVGGPGSGDSYVDDRTDYVSNEVATDYNAGFTGALARLYLDFGGTPIPENQFPAAETRDAEIYVEAKTNSSGSDHVQISTRVYNKSAWPARLTDNLTLRYWVDLNAEIAAGYQASDVTITLPYEQGATAGALQVWGDPADNLYYVDVSYVGTDIFPGKTSSARKEAQLRLQLPNGATAWDNSADPSWNNYSSSSYSDATGIAIYEGSTLVWGAEPTPACGAATGINCLPSATELSATTDYEVAVSLLLQGADSDGSISAYQISQAPANGTVTLSGASATYTPDIGFFGTDSFSYQVMDDDSEWSADASVTITVEEPIIPAVTILSPADGSSVVVDDSLALTFEFVHSASIAVELDGVEIQTGVTSSPISITAPSNTGTFTVELIAQDANGNALNASDSISLQAVANTAPVASFSASALGLTATFDASASYDNDGHSLSYNWDFGDGNTASTTATSISHSYAVAGSYSVSLTVSDGRDSHTSSQTVTVTEPTAGALCSYAVTKEWSSGWNTNISITNTSADVISGWQLTWVYDDGSTIRKGWSANFSGLGTATAVATPLSWNTDIDPGETITFGFVSDKVNSGDPITNLTLTGDICQ
ncbi:MAG: glycoside hydrolase family 9 protein, partial [Oceanobacter sp.]